MPEAAAGEIVFNSRSPKPMAITPTFYTLDGTIVMADPVTIASEEIRYVDIKQLLPERYRNERGWGGFSLSYEGFNREMWSQYRFVGVNGGSNVDEFFTVKEESRSDDLEAAWWMPDKSDAVIALGNITDLPTSATVTFGDDPNRTVRLAPHATEILRFHSEKGEEVESAIINVTGAAGSIVPTGLITSKDGSFNSVIRFYGPKLTKQSNLYGNGFRLRGNKPHMVLRNTTSNSIAVVPKFTPLTGKSPYFLPPLSLQPNETKEVDLTPLLRTAKNRRDLDVVTVEVTNWAAPGSLIGSLYGIDDRRSGVNYDIPLRDSGPIRTMTGSYPWDIGNDFSTIVYVTNIDDKPAEFVGQINYPGGHFVIDARKLSPGETAVFDLQKIRDSQTADNLGTKLPKKASIGQFKWAIHSSTKGKVALIGRAEMVSRSDDMSSSYSCSEACPPFYDYWIDPLGGYIVVSESGNTAAWQQAYYDSGYSMGPYSADASWSLDSSAASIDPASAHATAVTGEDADVGGDVIITADMGVQDRYYSDGVYCYYSYTEPMIAGTSVKIAGISNAVMVEGREYEDGTADFYTISPCDVTCKESGSVRLNVGCSSGLARKYRTQYWVKSSPILPRICVPYAVTYSNSFCDHPADCFETTLVP
ncbi:MAG: hypothetical protein ABI923_03440 [bacterium]